MKVDFASYQDWAVKNKIHKDVVGYLSFATQDLYDFDAKSSSRAFATPRTWTFVSQLLEDEDGDNDTLTNLIAGTVGEGLAVKFMAHRKVSSKMPNPADVLAGKVKDLNVKEVSAMYSLVISMCYELSQDVDNPTFYDKVEQFLTFSMKNFDTELVVMAMKLALTQYQLPIDPDKVPSFDEFHEKYGKYIKAAQN